MKLKTASWAVAVPLAMLLTAPQVVPQPASVAGLVPVAAAAETRAAQRPIVYNPSKRGTPATRVASHTRAAVDSPLVLALAPYDTGETTLAQPTLYWYASRPVNAKVELTIVEEKTQKTVLEVAADGPVEPGIWAFPIGVHRIALVPDVEYRWSISVVRDAKQRSLDLFASGTILRVSLPGQLAAQLNKVGPSELPFFLASAGLWYDALAVLSVQIANNPADRNLREMRASLLEQVGLTEAAAYDRVI